jgi:AcrR family transcriptional regulator
MAGRSRAMPDEELKSRMFAAAGELLDQVGGFTLSLEHLNLETVMRRADVSRSAVYRVWPTKDDFNIELLEMLAAPSWQGAAALDEETLVLAEEIIMSQPKLLETAEGRRAALLEAVRQSAWQNFVAISKQPAWRTFVVLSLTLPSVPAGERRDRLAQRLQESDALFSTRMATFYEMVLPVLGLRPRQPFTHDDVYDLLAKIGGALVEGLAVHQGLDPELGSRRFPGPGGEWSPPAIGFLAILDALVEPDPNHPGGGVS